jgi:DNA-binding LacI/PurR family transcriptional regulator
MTLADVAKAANVSVSTVSRVINNVSTVSQSTRRRVLKAIEAANYNPNLQARSLVTGNSRVIGVVVSNLQNPFFVDVYRALEQLTFQNGYELLMVETGYESDRLAAGMRLMLGRRVSGLIFVVSESSPSTLADVRRLGIPAVFFDVGKPGPGLTNIRFDSFAGMTQMVEFLSHLRHRRIAYIGVPRELQPAIDRQAAVKTAAAKLGIEHRVFSVPDWDGFAGGRDATRLILQSGFRPTAILCCNDITAFGVLRELRNQDISVPGDISVTGFDNIELAEFSSPSLTTVEIPSARIASLMFDAITNNDRAGQETVVSPKVIVRESTGPARTA